MNYTMSGEVTIMMMRDLNAKVGTEKEVPTTGQYGLGERNGRETRLIEFFKVNKLAITNTFF